MKWGQDHEPPFRRKTIDQKSPRTHKRDKQRFERQIRALSGVSPYSRSLIATLRTRRGAIIRLPLAIFLLLGGLVSFLPLFGLWMIPFGLLLLAIDLPILQPVVSATIIRLRRRWAVLRRWWHRSWKRKKG